MLHLAGLHFPRSVIICGKASKASSRVGRQRLHWSVAARVKQFNEQETWLASNNKIQLSSKVPSAVFLNWAINHTYNKKLIRRWDSKRELSLRRHCTRSKNAIDSCINSATDRFLQHGFTKFSEITQCNGHYAVQGHSRSPILVPIENSYATSY